MFGLNLAVMGDGEIAQLIDLLNSSMEERTGTFYWHELNLPYTNSMLRWINWLSVELEDRYWEHVDRGNCGHGGECERCFIDWCPEWVSEPVLVRTCIHAGRLNYGSVLRCFSIKYQDAVGFHGMDHGRALAFAIDGVAFAFGADEPCGYLANIIKKAGYTPTACEEGMPF